MGQTLKSSLGLHTCAERDHSAMTKRRPKPKRKTGFQALRERIAANRNRVVDDGAGLVTQRLLTALNTAQKTAAKEPGPPAFEL